MRDCVTRLPKARDLSTPVARAAVALVLILAFILFPWSVSGPVSYDASNPLLVHVTPTNTGGVTFNQSSRQIDILASQTGGPRVDLVTSESSYGFSTDVEVLHQQLSSMGDWYWVSSDTPVPWPSAFFRVKLEAGNMTSLDIGVVRVSEMNGSDLFTADFQTQGNGGWNLFNGASFAVQGSPSREAIHLVSNSTSVQSATTVDYHSISPDANIVTVSALVRFASSPGPFKIETDWYRSDGSYIKDQTDYNAWSSYLDIPAAVVFRMWYPATQQDARLRFAITNSSSGHIFLELIENDRIGLNQTIANYTVGQRFRFTASWNKDESIGFSLSNNVTTLLQWSSNSKPSAYSLSDLIKQGQVNLAVSSEGFSSESILYGPIYLYPGTSRYVSFSADGTPLYCSLLLLVGLTFLWYPEEKRIAEAFRTRIKRLSRINVPQIFRRHALLIIGLVTAVLLYVYTALSFGGHPFDQEAFKTWTYTGHLDGLRGIWGRATSVPDSYDRGGTIPWSSVTFAYLPLASYLILAMSMFVPFGSYSSQDAMLSSSLLQGEIKLVLGCFTFLAGLLLYWIVLRYTGSRPRALLAFLFLVLNPAVFFDSAVWGETDAVLFVAFILFAFLAKNRPGAALAVFLLAVDVKQTGIILLLPSIIILSSLGQNLRSWIVGFGKGGSMLFATLVPLLASGILPSAIYKPFFAKLADIGTAFGNGTPTLSADTYTAWTIFSGPFGIISTPSNTPLIFGASFSTLGYITYVALAAAVFIRVRKHLTHASTSFWFGMVAFSSIAFNAVLTGGASRYYTLAIPCQIGMMALGWKEFSRGEKRTSAAVLVLITFISAWTMTGILGWIMANDYPNIHGLQLSHNPLTAFIYQFYLNGVVITIGSIAAIVAVYLSARLVISLSQHHADP